MREPPRTRRFILKNHSFGGIILNILNQGHQTKGLEILKDLEDLKSEKTRFVQRRDSLKPKIGRLVSDARRGDEESSRNLAKVKQELDEISKELADIDLAIETTEIDYRAELKEKKYEAYLASVKQVRDTIQPEAIKEMELSENALKESLDHWGKARDLVDEAFTPDGTSRSTSPLSDMKLLHAWPLACRRIGNKQHPIFNNVIRTLTPTHQIPRMTDAILDGFASVYRDPHNTDVE